MSTPVHTCKDHQGITPDPDCKACVAKGRLTTAQIAETPTSIPRWAGGLLESSPPDTAPVELAAGAVSGSSRPR